MEKAKVIQALRDGKIALVSRYNRMLVKRGKWADLTGADLRDADLTRAVLTRADLRDAVLEGADLTRAVLTWANLTGADLRDAVLTWANLRNAVLEGADLRDADLTRADLTRAVLRGANLDFSSGLPRWCGSFNVKVDDKYAYDQAYHFCRLIFPEGSDGEKIQKYLKKYANKSGLIERHELEKIR